MWNGNWKQTIFNKLKLKKQNKCLEILIIVKITLFKNHFFYKIIIFFNDLAGFILKYFRCFKSKIVFKLFFIVMCYFLFLLSF